MPLISYWIKVQCKDCKTVYPKRADSVKHWKGRCKVCTLKFINSLPEMKEVRRKLGLGFMKTFGYFLRGPRLKNRPRGAAHYKWRGGVTREQNKIWLSAEYKSWRKAIFSRDGFQCVACHKNTHDLQADHIKPFTIHPELRFAVTNGRTMCRPCHGKYGSRTSGGKLIREASFEYACEIQSTEANVSQ